MGFGPRESPNPGLLPPRGDRASTTVASSVGSLHTTTQQLATSHGRNRSTGHRSSLSSTIQGSFRATKSQGLPPQHQPHAANNELDHTNHGELLRCSTSPSTTEVLIAEVSNIKKSPGAARPPERIPCNKLDNECAATCDASSTIQGSFRATKSQGLPLTHHLSSSKLSAADLHCNSLSTTDSGFEGISTIKGTFRATKSQGLHRTPNKLNSTNSEGRLRCSVSLDEIAETGTASSHKSSSHNQRQHGGTSGRTSGKPDLHGLLLSSKYIPEGKLKPVSDLASQTSSEAACTHPATHGASMKRLVPTS